MWKSERAHAHVEARVKEKKVVTNKLWHSWLKTGLALSHWLSLRKMADFVYMWLLSLPLSLSLFSLSLSRLSLSLSLSLSLLSLLSLSLHSIHYPLPLPMAHLTPLNKISIQSYALMVHLSHHFTSFTQSFQLRISSQFIYASSSFMLAVTFNYFKHYKFTTK